MDDLSEFVIYCRLCDKRVEIKFDLADYYEWQDGAYIQDAMPYLTKEQREMFISQTCDDCWEDLFGQKTFLNDLDN